MNPVETKKSGMSVAVRTARYGRRYWKLFLSLVVITALFSAVFGARSYLVKPLVDKGILGKELNTAIELALMAAGLSLLIFPLKYLKDYFAGLMTQRVACDLRNDVSEHFLHQPMSFFYDRKTGDIISRTTNDVLLMESAVKFIYDIFLGQSVMLMAFVATLFVTNWLLALMTLAIWPVLLFPLMKLGRKIRKTRRKSLEQLGDVTESLVQMYSGIRIVKAFGMEEEEKKDFEHENMGLFRRMMSVVKKKALSESLVELIQMVGLSVIMVAIIYFNWRGMIDLPSVAMFVGVLPLMSNSFRELANGYTKFQEALSGCERIFDILSMPRQPEDTPEAAELKSIAPGVEYQNVWFAYDTEPVLKDISLRVTPGEIVAVVGRSGAGKSTLLDMLCRFHDPREGRITVGGIDLRQVKRKSLMDHIAVVTQDPFLFNRTIAENIRYGHRDARMEDVISAARSANIHDFIQTLDLQYDTVVGERGIKLSGGQRQRIAIARAILKNPDILILDEATSSLDTESERQVQEAINNLITKHGDASHRITFVIAHRLSTVKNADRILVLEEGHLAEVGSHAELLQRNGIYARLYQTQFSD